MKKTILLFAAAAATFFFAAMTGCETEKLSDTQLSISPSSATVAPGGSVTFTAQGGWDYSWKVDLGYLSTYNGKKVTYTAPGSNSTNATEATAILTVSTGSVSNSPSKSATAIITIKGN